MLGAGLAGNKKIVHVFVNLHYKTMRKSMEMKSPSGCMHNAT